VLLWSSMLIRGTHRARVILCMPLSGRGSKSNDSLRRLFPNMIILLCCRCKLRRCFQAQFHHAGHCNCVLFPCVVSNHSSDLQVETCRPRGPKWNLIPTMWCPGHSRCAGGGSIIKIQQKLVTAPFKASDGLCVWHLYLRFVHMMFVSDPYTKHRLLTWSVYIR